MASRRALLIGLAGAAGLIPAAALAVEPKAKVSKAAARYQDRPKDIQACATCTLFLPPDGCKGVDGQVSPEGWCALYDMVD